MVEIMIRKAQPTPGDVHVNRPLTNISIAYMQQASQFVADRVFPNIPVQKQSDLYFTYDRGFFFRSEMKKRGPGSESAGIDYKVDATPNYFCPVWAIHHDVPDQRRANSDSPLQPDREATELLMQQALVKREIEWASNYFTTSKWTTDLSPATKWDAASGSDPLGEIETGKTTVGASTGLEPNSLVMGRLVWGVLRNHADIVDRIKYGQTAPGAANVSIQAFADLIEVPDVMISRAVQNSAAEGLTNSIDYILGDSALLVYSAPNPGLMTPSGGYTFSWTGYAGAGPGGQRISRFRMEWLKADRVELEMSFDQKLVAADLGYFLNDVLT